MRENVTPSETAEKMSTEANQLDGHDPHTQRDDGIPKLKPFAVSGVLDATFSFEDTTPSIGREYFSVNIVHDILNASNSEDLIRDLAITGNI